MISLLVGLVSIAIVLLAVLHFRIGRDGGSEALGLRIEPLQRGLDRSDRTVREEMARNREESAQLAGAARQELAAAVRALADSLQTRIAETSLAQRSDMELLRGEVAARLEAIQRDNSSRLELMRQTVDEKLQGTLERRLGESFRTVSERLEQVHKGLGEMQALASGVGDLKRVLTNIKTRGVWGEVLLGSLLEQILAPAQFERNVACREGSAQRVEFAIRFPGRDAATPVFLPIDSKFPQEDYLRLIEAADRADAPAVEEAARALEACVRGCARDINEKYVCPPRTTDFAILFVPIEGLYAEVLRRPGLCEEMQKMHVIACGPTTLAALLNSLQMGFKTLAIQQRSSEIWMVLGAVKAEFGKFGGTIDRLQRKLQQVNRVVDDAAIRTRQMDRKLREVEELPAAEAEALLQLPNVPLPEAEV